MNPGVWDCRAAAYSVEGKGKAKWRWSPEALAACTVAVGEDIKSLSLEDGLLGKWTMQPSSRKSPTVNGGRVAAMGAPGFAAWLEKQGLRWREQKLTFGKNRSVTLESAQGTFEIVSPGVVEVF